MKGLCLFLISALGPVAFHAAQAKTLEHDGITYTYIPETGQATGLRVGVCPDGKGYSHTRIEIPRSINDGFADYPVVAIAANAFAGCENLTFLSLPEGVTEISGAIGNCPVLETVVLPNSLKFLSGIENCPGLKQINFPAALTKVNWAINDCAVSSVMLAPENTVTISRSFNRLHLENLVLDNVEMVEYKAFCNLDVLKVLKFPASVKGIGLEIFCKCDFEEIWFEDNRDGLAIKIDYEAFADTDVERIYMNCRTMPVLWSFWPFGYGAWPDCPPDDDDYQWAYTPYTYPFMTGSDGRRPTLADLAEIRLFVPEGCGAMYEADPYWGNFSVEEFPFEAGLKDEAHHTPAVSVTGADGVLTVDNTSVMPMEVTVYDCLGALKATFTVGASSVISRQMDAGMYVVKCGDTAHKVLVR